MKICIKKILIVVVVVIIFIIMILNEYYRSKSYKYVNEKIILSNKILDSLNNEIFELKRDIIIIRGCPNGKK